MQIDRRVVSRFADQCDDALRLAERIGADQMRTFRKQRHRGQELRHFIGGIAMAKHRKAEGGFGDEHIARHHLERRAGRIGCVLVIAGRYDARSAMGDGDLRRAQYMSRRVECRADLAKRDGLAIGNRLRAAREVVAIAQPHHVERFLRRQHRTVAGARMIRMAVRDQRPFHRPHRIDVKAAGLAAQACGGRHQDVLGAHAANIGRIRRS